MRSLDHDWICITTWRSYGLIETEGSIYRRVIDDVYIKEYYNNTYMV